MDEGVGSGQLEQLPDELLLLLVSFLDSGNLFHLHSVSRRFLRLLQDDAVWRDHFVRRFPSLVRDRQLAKFPWKERLRLVHSCWSRGSFAVTHRVETVGLGGIRYISFCDDDENLILGGTTTGHIAIWNLDANDDKDHHHATGILTGEISSIPAHDQWVRCVTRRQDTIFSGSSDFKIRLWSLATKKMLCSLNDHTNQVNIVKLMPDALGRVTDSTILVSASDDQTVGQWDIERGVLTRSFTGHTGWVLALDCDYNTIISAGNGGPAFVWDIRTGSSVRTITLERSPIRFLEFNEHTLALGGDRYLGLWDMRGQQFAWQAKDGDRFDETAWVVRMYGSHLLVGADHSRVQAHKLSDPSQVDFTLEDEAARHSAGIQSVQCSPTRVVHSSLKGYIHAWGPNSSHPSHD